MDLKPRIQIADPSVFADIANSQRQYSALVADAAAAQLPQQAPPAPTQLELETEVTRAVDLIHCQQH